VLVAAVACGGDRIVAEGQFGRPFSLMSGDPSPLPRLAFVDEGCPGEAGGCTLAGERACAPLLIDSLAPLSALKDDGGDDGPRFSIECIEVRQARGLAAPTPSATDLEAAVTRFRFHDLPLVRAPAAGTDAWTWLAGDANGQIDPGGVLGGNLLESFAVALRTPRVGEGRIAIYGEFPGSDRDLADQGRAFIPVQFPGRLLGHDIQDVCDIGGEDCKTGGFDAQALRPTVALRRTRMVLDACMAPPPCTVTYAPHPDDPFEPGTCGQATGPGTLEACVRADDPARGGTQATLLVATGVPDLVVFDDSAERMFGPLDALPDCGAIGPDTRACRVDPPGEPAGLLAVAGWPIAEPLVRLRVRAVALLPGLTSSRGEGPCERMRLRRIGLFNQCSRFVEAFDAEGDIVNTIPPYSGRDDSDADDPSDSALAVLGEAMVAADAPDPAGWIPTTVLPASHALTLSVRRDVVPEALQLDGLLGTVLLRDTLAILDYTDPNPGVRLSCLDPRSGDCLVAPDCSRDAQPACCHGLPLDLLVAFIVDGADETCCSALSAGELAEIQELGHCLGVAAL
jgi:hypothetical protein